ncbi:MAG: site-specific integrase [Alphaproteobacteria bacterium]|nr:site-specific integrase [Alphaproteobacteria bacterium]
MKNNVVEISPTKGEWAAVEAYLDRRYAPATKWMYGASVRKFEVWCRNRDLSALPAAIETVAMFVAHEAKNGMRPSTVARHLAAIRQQHLDADYDDPTSDPLIRSLLRGIRRTVGTAAAQKDPATVDILRRLVGQTDTSTKGIRDRAILLLGFAGAFRRGELAALEVGDLEFGDGRLRVLIKRSKSDQEQAGQEVEIAAGRFLCPLQAVREWVAAVGNDTGPLFRRVLKNGRVLDRGMTGHAIGRLVKAYAEKAGLDPAAFGAHSLRSGFLTSAAATGATVFELRAVSRHRNLEGLRPYVRVGSDRTAGAGLL